MCDFSYIQTILNGFTALDIEGLQCHLRKDRTYQEATAEMFLAVLREIFSRYKLCGDTKLTRYKGKCNEKNSPDFGKKGYRFVGNNSGNYMDLIFEETNDDILDIYACNFFEPYQEISNLRHMINPIIGEDEKAGFVKTPEYLVKLNMAYKAWKEITVTAPRKINFNEMRKWLEKHLVTYQNIGGYNGSDPYMKWMPFLRLYDDFQEISDYISLYYTEITEATSQIKNSQTNRN